MSPIKIMIISVSSAILGGLIVLGATKLVNEQSAIKEPKKNVNKPSKNEDNLLADIGSQQKRNLK